MFKKPLRFSFSSVYFEWEPGKAGGRAKKREKSKERESSRAFVKLGLSELGAAGWECFCLCYWVRDRLT